GMSVSISPTSATYSAGNTISITANVVGGIAPYKYIFYNNTTGTPLSFATYSTSSNSVTDSITAKTNKGAITGFDYPSYVAFAPSGTYAYVANYDNSTVSIVNTTTDSIVNTITGFVFTLTVPEGGVSGVAFAPSGTYAYVADPDTKVDYIVNTLTNSIVNTITGFNGQWEPEFNGLWDVAFAPNGAYAYATDGDLGIYIINTATNSIVN
ncbi:MAG: YncE family protein, partial [Candidatus Micrarchaeia archaeon]